MVDMFIQFFVAIASGCTITYFGYWLSNRNGTKK